MLETTSAVRSTSDTAAWASSTTTLVYLFIVLFLAAAAICGGLVCIAFGWSSPLLRCPPGPSVSNPSAPERQSILGLALPQRNASAHPQQLAYIFALPNRTRDSCCTARNDAAGLAAERDLRPIYWRRVCWRRPRRQSKRSMAIPHVRCPSISGRGEAGGPSAECRRPASTSHAPPPRRHRAE